MTKMTAAFMFKYNKAIQYNNVKSGLIYISIIRSGKDLVGKANNN